MAEKRKLVIKKGRRQRAASRKFDFRREMIPVSANGTLEAYRASAWDAYEKLPMPSTQDEAWRRTDLRKMPAESFRLAADAPQALAPVPESLLKPLLGDRHGGEITLRPDGADISLAPELAAQGIVFTDFKTAEKEHPDLLAKLIGQVVRADEGKFAALAAAFASNGILLYVPRGVQVENPFHSVFWGAGAALAHFSHLLIYLDEGASATYVHEAASPNEASDSLHAGIVEITLAKGANLRFVELQSWGKHVWNFSHERAKIGRDANLDWVFGAVGSGLTKNFSGLDLVGQGAAGKMSGFYFADGNQHFDHDTEQNHLVPHTSSDLLFKGALKGESRSVWQGMVYVAEGAQKTDGYQANRNLLLSDRARADSIPGLKIAADDVRCSHGATVGKIDREPLFYLLSRGIPEADAERLMVEGFFDPIMQRIPFEGVRARFQQAITDKLNSGD